MALFSRTPFIVDAGHLEGSKQQTVRPDLHQLMAQVAAGVIAPEAAVSRVQEQVNENITAQGQENGSAAEQMLNQLASAGKFMTDSGSSSKNDHAISDEPSQVE